MSLCMKLLSETNQKHGWLPCMLGKKLQRLVDKKKEKLVRQLSGILYRKFRTFCKGTPLFSSWNATKEILVPSG